MSTNQYETITTSSEERIEETAEDTTSQGTQAQTSAHEEEQREATMAEDTWIEEEFPDEEVVDEEIPDEELPDEEETPSKNNYHIENATGSTAQVVAGDHAQMHNQTTYTTITNRFDHLQIVLEAKKRDQEDTDTAFHTIQDLIEQAIALARQNSPIPTQKTAPEEKPLPTTREAFSNWFYALDDYEQAYVQAAALLHGASAYEISQRADQLYMLHHVPDTISSPLTTHSPTIQANEHRADLLSLHKRSSRDLQANTFTITQRVDGVERLYWRDVRSDGISPFHLQLLDFLAEEHLSKGRQGETFLEQVRKWAQERKPEYSRYVARALGVFLWRQDASKLQRQAETWARNSSVPGWQRTAILLDSAYEIDVIKYPEHEQESSLSPALQLLSKWIERAQKLEHKVDINLGCATAHTCALIGKRKLDIALHGLAQLQQFPVEQPVDVERLQATIASAYFALGWSGDLRCVLHHLATLAEQAVLQHSLPATLRQRRQYRLQCQLRLKMYLDAFLFLAFDSSSNVAVWHAETYQEPLPSLPSQGERQRRDILLAGVLEADSMHWRKEVVTLLSAAIFDRNSRDSAFVLLSRWADAVLKLQDASSMQTGFLMTSFQAFLVDVGLALDRWCLDVAKENRQSPASLAYQHRLEKWSKKKGAFGILFQQVMSRYSAYERQA
jgi:hypothetical protein